MKYPHVLFVMLLVIDILSCTRVDDSPGSGGTLPLNLNPPGTLPVVDRLVTLTGFIPSAGLIADISNNLVMQKVTERTNIRMEWIESSKIDARNKLRLLFASGNYPGIIQGTNGSGLSNQDIAHYGIQGIFLPLNDLIDKHGINIKEMFRTHPFVLDAITAADGNIYGLPAVFTDDYHMTMRQKLWINQTWLNNLGLPMPKTLEELYRVLIAFRDHDANGNGDPRDEIPLTGAKRSLEDVAMWIMNSFTPAGGPDESGDAQLNNYEFIIEGKVIFTANTQEFREGLRFLKILYDEQLLEVKAFTQGREQIRSKIDGVPFPQIGAVASHHPGNFAEINDNPAAPFRQYVALPPVSGPDGTAYTPWMIDAVIEPGQFVITRNVENPELAIRLADYYFSLEFAEIEKGVEGYHWRRLNNSNRVAINGSTAKYEYLRTLRSEDNSQINMGPMWTRDLKNEFARASSFSYEEMLYNATKLYAAYKVPRFPYATASIDPQDTDEFDYLRRTIHTFVGESVHRFIIGDLDIESQWNEYVGQLNRIGLPRYIEILNFAYDNEN